MKKIILFLFAGILLAMTACQEPKDEVVALDTKGTVNVVMQVTHENAGDILTTTKTVYNLQGNVVKTIVTIDTVPFLGMTKETLSYVKNEGYDNEEERDTIITHAKDYQFFISVKK